MVEELKLTLAVSFEFVMTSVFILFVTMASFDGSTKEVDLEWIEGVVVVSIDFKFVVVVVDDGDVDVVDVVFEVVVVVDLVVDAVNAVHLTLKSPSLPPVEIKN